MLNRRQRITLARIFERPRRADLEWREVIGLLHALGAIMIEGRGSRVRVYLNGVVAVLHRPHPRKELRIGAVASLQRFLTSAGVEPEN